MTWRFSIPLQFLLRSASSVIYIILKRIEDRGHCLEGNQGDEDKLHISSDRTGRNEISEKMKRCQGRWNGAESNTGATSWKFKENRVD
jgi:hypothetical protein